MRIAVNTRFLLKGKMEGFGWFTYETIKRITTSHPEHEFIFFFDRPYDEKFIFSSNITPVVLNPPARHPILFKIWFNRSVTKALKKYKADIFLSPDGFLSLKTNVDQVAVMHDLNFEHNPQDLPKSARNYFKKHFPLFAKKAKHLITVSEYSKKDIINTYAIQEDKITVSHNGGSEAFTPIDEHLQNEIRNTFTQGKEFFLFVGALSPRKNLSRLLTAFDDFKKEGNSDTKLLVVGEAIWKNKAMQLQYDEIEHKDDILFTGHLSLEKLTKIMGSAKALCFVSYFEGFGIPLVEAMNADCPIMCGNKTSLPEIAGDAAILVDPFSVSEIKDGLISLDNDAELRTSLIEKGRLRKKEFSWDKTAQIIWEVLAKELNC